MHTAINTKQKLSCIICNLDLLSDLSISIYGLNSIVRSIYGSWLFQVLRARLCGDANEAQGLCPPGQPGGSCGKGCRGCSTNGTAMGLAFSSPAALPGAGKPEEQEAFSA